MTKKWLYLSVVFSNDAMYMPKQSDKEKSL